MLDETVQATILSESWRRSWKLWNVGSFRCGHEKFWSNLPSWWNQVERETCKYLKQNNEIKAMNLNELDARWRNLWSLAGRVHPWGQVVGEHVELTNCWGKMAGFAALAFRNRSSRSRSLQKVCLGVLASRNMGFEGFFGGVRYVNCEILRDLLVVEIGYSWIYP